MVAWKSAVAFSTLTLTTAIAHAGVSDDLVFCSKLTNGKERIACYDAAARIASNPPSATQSSMPRTERMVSAPVADVASPLAYRIEPERNAFQGGYAALGGSYGFSSTRSFGLSDGLSTSVFDTVPASGFSGVAAIGYNATISNFLFGVELQGRAGKEAAAFDSTKQQANNFGLTGTASYAYRINNNAGLHVAARAGAFFDNTLVFVRGGIGASHIDEYASVDTRATSCAPPTCFFTFTPALAAQNVSRWVPSAVVGAGIEHNFGSVFIRMEGEVEAVALQTTRFSQASGGTAGATSEPLWFTRAIASAGVRF